MATNDIHSFAIVIREHNKNEYTRRDGSLELYNTQKGSMYAAVHFFVTISVLHLERLHSDWTRGSQLHFFLNTGIERERSTLTQLSLIISALSLKAFIADSVNAHYQLRNTAWK